MSEIVGVVQEIDTIDKEIKTLRLNLSRLTNRKKILETKIINFLDQKDQPGLKYKDITIISEEKDRHFRLKKKDRLQKGKNILQKYGVPNSEKVLEELLNNLKGDAVSYKKVKISKVKEKV